MSEHDKKKKSLRASFLDGTFASAMIGFTQDYFTPFLLLLGATAKQVGMLAALPNLFAAVIQLKSPDVTERFRSRKKVITTFVMLQALVLLPMAAIALLKIAIPGLFIAMVVMFTSLGALSMPAWGSLMSDLVSEDKRGSYFGWRNRVLGCIVITSALIAGLILTLMKRTDIFIGFGIIFLGACVFRIISWYFLTKMYEPDLVYRKEDNFSLVDFVSRIGESNFAKFVLFVSLMNFSVTIAAPFFSVLMLQDMHFSYIVYTVVTVSATAMVYLMMGRWGRHADKVGNLKVIKFTTRFISIIPLFWIINRNPVFLVVIQLFSGLLWAGFNLCTSNFIYDAVSPPKRTRCIAYFNVFNGIALCGGALVGGFLLQRLPPLFGYRILMLCLISSIARLTVAFSLPHRLKEVRSIDKVGSKDLFFSVIGIKPLLGVERKSVGFEI